MELHFYGFYNLHQNAQSLKVKVVSILGYYYTTKNLKSEELYITKTGLIAKLIYSHDCQLFEMSWNLSNFLNNLALESNYVVNLVSWS